MASQITSFAIVYLTVYSGTDERKHESSASLAFVAGNSPVTDEFPAQKASNAENLFIWWRHHVVFQHAWIHAKVRLTATTRHVKAAMCTLPVPGVSSTITAPVLPDWSGMTASKSAIITPLRAAKRQREIPDGLFLTDFTEAEMSSFWWHFSHWLSRKLSCWTIMKISLNDDISVSLGHFRATNPITILTPGPNTFFVGQ